MNYKNELKNLIYIQENKACNEQTINGLFRSIVEPVLESNAESLVLLRLEENSKKSFNSILRRLEYSKSEVYDFSKEAIGEKFENLLKNDIWGRTEFVYVLTERFGAVLIFDYEESDIENFAQFYVLHNSKDLSVSFEFINSNSTKDLSNFEDKWKPDRRNNELLNLSIRKIIESFSESNQEVMISQAGEVQIDSKEDLISRMEFLLEKSGYIAHEMRNMLSIANLYSEIIDKHSQKVSFSDEDARKSVLNARDCIKKSMQMTGNLLLDFKSIRNTVLKQVDLIEIVNSAIDLSRVYGNAKDIRFESQLKGSLIVLADENKFLTVLINLLKNAVESIEEKGDIVIKTEDEDEVLKLIISNNGKAISEELQSKIFDQGFTTKSTGSGLGLVICKKTLEEQFAKLSLRKSDGESTEFEITVLKG